MKSSGQMMLTHALECVDGLIKTGATGTNVNDVAVVLIKR